jgi:hypothetical protein
MIYIGPRLLAVVKIGSLPTTFLPSCHQFFSLSQTFGLSPVELNDGREGEGRGTGAKLYERPLKIIQYSLADSIN